MMKIKIISLTSFFILLILLLSLSINCYAIVPTDISAPLIDEHMERHLLDHDIKFFGNILSIILLLLIITFTILTLRIPKKCIKTSYLICIIIILILYILSNTLLSYESLFPLFSSFTTIFLLITVLVYFILNYFFKHYWLFSILVFLCSFVILLIEVAIPIVALLLSIFVQISYQIVMIPIYLSSYFDKKSK